MLNIKMKEESMSDFTYRHTIFNNFINFIIFVISHYLDYYFSYYFLIIESFFDIFLILLSFIYPTALFMSLDLIIIHLFFLFSMIAKSV